MIESTQTVVIDRPIGTVWSFVRDIQDWADLMPGLQACDVIDDDNSRWSLKVGAGGMVRKVDVLVHVDQWDGPERVFFTYKLKRDPVQGGGSYHARPAGEGTTEIDLHVQVAGSGSMAPMWEAMGKPLLPKLVAGFANQLKAKIEAGIEPVAVDAPTEAAVPIPGKHDGEFAWLLNWMRSLFGRRVRG